MAEIHILRNNIQKEPKSDLERQLNGYQLTTAEILYYFPDYPDLLQSYIWQEYDKAPKFPVLYNFLNFWNKKLDGKLHSVYVVSKKIISPASLNHINFEISYN